MIGLGRQDATRTASQEEIRLGGRRMDEAIRSPTEGSSCSSHKGKTAGSRSPGAEKKSVIEPTWSSGEQESRAPDDEGEAASKFPDGANRIIKRVADGRGGGQES